MEKIELIALMTAVDRTGDQTALLQILCKQLLHLRWQQQETNELLSDLLEK